MDYGTQARQCGRKRIYPDADHAISAAVAMQGKTQVQFDAYSCQWCNAWHVGRHRTVEQAQTSAGGRRE